LQTNATAFLRTKSFFSGCMKS